VVRSQIHKAQKFQSRNVGLGLAIAKQILDYITKAFGLKAHLNAGQLLPLIFQSVSPPEFVIKR
jgi:hypothetical protein